MTFSVEPGLYDEKSGIGINPSDRLIVLEDRVGADEPDPV